MVVLCAIPIVIVYWLVNLPFDKIWAEERKKLHKRSSLKPTKHTALTVIWFDQLLYL